MAVKRRLKKKYAGLTIRNLLFLSIFRSKVLKDAFAALIFRISNLRMIIVIKKTGRMIEMIKTMYEISKRALRRGVELLSSIIFINEKKVASK